MNLLKKLNAHRVSNQNSQAGIANRFNLKVADKSKGFYKT